MVSEELKLGLAQIAPVWMDRARTLEKVEAWVERAAADGCGLVAFGEALVPGYPFWVELTEGARFESPLQRAAYAEYASQAVQPETWHLDGVRAVARSRGIAVYLGCIERAVDRGGHSLYCSLVYIDSRGEIGSVHRKLTPTHEERLVWAPGDGNGLRTHAIGAFHAGGLNCWENWMLLSRAALYGQGEDLHVAVWPGNTRNTRDITRFVAMEGRSYVASVSGLMRRVQFGDGSEWRRQATAAAPEILADGGSCLAGPDGEWVIAPASSDEVLLTATLDFQRVLEARHSLDPAGHYSRPDVTRLTVDRRRQGLVEIRE